MKSGEPYYEYTVTMTPPKRVGRFVGFSQTEIKHLTVGASLVMGVGASLFLSDFTLIMVTFLALMLTFSFLIHEMAHKIAAQRQGLWAEFRLTLLGALITLISIFSPLFKIISPGAVMVAGVGDRETIGKTAFAGPLTNIMLATLFLVASLIIMAFDPRSIMSFATIFVAWINSFIAVFNLIPFGVIDGYKIFRWNRIIWALSFSVSIMLAIPSFFFLSLSM
jgi:Zn-dependent protease